MLQCLEAARLTPATIDVTLNIQQGDARVQQEKSYKTVAELTEDFRALVLHPSDFKPVVKELIITKLLAPLEAKKKGSKTFANAVKLLETYHKKATKK